MKKCKNHIILVQCIFFIFFAFLPFYLEINKINFIETKKEYAFSSSEYVESTQVILRKPTISIVNFSLIKNIFIFKLDLLLHYSKAKISISYIIIACLIILKKRKKLLILIDNSGRYKDSLQV